MRITIAALLLLYSAGAQPPSNVKLGPGIRTALCKQQRQEPQRCLVQMEAASESARNVEIVLRSGERVIVPVRPGDTAAAFRLEETERMVEVRIK